MNPKPCHKEMNYVNPRRGLGGAHMIPLGWTRDSVSWSFSGSHCTIVSEVGLHGRDN